MDWLVHVQLDYRDEVQEILPDNVWSQKVIPASAGVALLHLRPFLSSLVGQFILE